MTELLLTALLFFQTAAVPDTLDAGELAGQTVYFTLEGNEFRGAAPLLDALDSAHYVVLGELHNRRQLGRLTEALLHRLRPAGFRYLAVETGPHSAEKLEKLISGGREEVSDFYGRYSSKLFGIYPIPFFTGEADLEFLAAADSLGYELWGLDQEFYFAFRYLVDELAELARQNGTPLNDRESRWRRGIKRRLYWWHRRAQLFSGFPMSCRLKEDNRYASYMQRLGERGDPEISGVVEAARKSLEIYCMAEKGQASSPVRVAYFKEQFDRNLEEARRADPDPRVLVKFGSYHAGRHQSPLGLKDLGHHLHHLADSTGRKSVHLRYMDRFTEDGEDLAGRSGSEPYATLRSVGRRDRWALVDLRPLRRRLEEGTLHANTSEVREIRNYDFLLVSPEDRRVNRHY